MIFGNLNFGVGYVDTFSATETYDEGLEGHFVTSALTRGGIDNPQPLTIVDTNACSGISVPSGLVAKVCKRNYF